MLHPKAVKMFEQRNLPQRKRYPTKVKKRNYFTFNSFTEVLIKIWPDGMDLTPNSTLFDHVQFLALSSLTASVPIIFLIFQL